MNLRNGMFYDVYDIYFHKRPDIISQNMNDLKTKNA